MDVSEKLRRLKRSLDGFISFRKAVFIIGATLMVVLYLGPSFFDWLLGESNYRMGEFDAFWVDLVGPESAKGFDCRQSRVFQRPCLLAWTKSFCPTQRTFAG